jgi:hypothetical protein
MKLNDAKRKIREIQNAQQVENIASGLNRARSITVGTAFGGTTEVMMRSDGGRHIWCVMQPVEVIELIHQLAANVGCSADLTPRKDFSSWRDWRVSEAEKNHLQGQPPFVNDMALFQKLGASGFDEEEAKKIMDFLASQVTFANENDDAEIIGKETKNHAGPARMVGKEDGLLHNKLALFKDKVVYMAGGDGGISPDLVEELAKKAQNEQTMATKKTVNQRKSKRTAASS